MNTQYDAWLYDQLQPEEILFVGYRNIKGPPAWAIKFPDRLIGLVPQKRTEQEWLEIEDNFLQSKGIK